jgi:tRNA-modifying protein YgfZ
VHYVRRMTHVSHLESRAVLSVSGEDRVSFLQGLVSNDVALASPGNAVWAALLTPQGKWLADFFIFADADRLLIDCEAAQSADLARRLSRFRLRARVEVASEPWFVYAAWGGSAPAGDIVAPDPRLEAAGWRILAQAPLAANATAADYDHHRLSLGLPDGSRDMEAEKSVLLEAGFDELSGVSWTKGCYLGQELTARTKYRGLIKRRLLPVSGESALPSPGTPILRDGAEVGVLRSVDGILGLALVRLDALGGVLQCGGTAIEAHVPSWMQLSKAG